MAEEEYRGPVPCILDPMLDCPARVLGLVGCSLHIAAKNIFLISAKMHAKTPEEILELVRGPEEDLRISLRKENAQMLSEIGRVSQCAHPEANILSVG